jgi:hypothetical protein
MNPQVLIDFPCAAVKAIDVMMPRQTPWFW